MSAYQHRTDPADRPAAQHPKKPRAKPLSKTPSPLLDSDLTYLAALIETRGDRVAALERTGYHLTTPKAQDSMHRKILQRIDESQDVHGVLTGIGLGLSKWAERLAWMYAQEDVKYTAVALKIHGIALGVFNPQAPSQGATINVYSVQAPGTTSQTGSPGLVQIAIDARRPPAEYPPQLSASDS